MIYDGRYQDALWRKMYVLIDEVHSDDVGYVGRRKAYDALKGFCEPQSSHKLLNIKGSKQLRALVAASVGIATNHFDSLPLELVDRRFFVATTTYAAMQLHEVQEIQVWLENDANIGALWRQLAAMDLSGFDAMRAPESEGKKQMAQANMSDFDALADEFYQLAKKHSGGLYSPDHIRAWAGRCMQRGLLDASRLSDFKRVLRRQPAKVFRVGLNTRRLYKLPGERLLSPDQRETALQDLSVALNGAEVDL